MRLIHTTEFYLQEFFDLQLPEYAILSHCWTECEVQYRDYAQDTLRNPQAKASKELLECCRTARKKIFDACALARKEGLNWVWVDTCCIDKSSSAELSEAINSMFSWYSKANVCFVFLSDFHGYRSAVMTQDLKACRWFSRGWTLQELLAPRRVLFYNSGIQCIGDRETLATQISSVTGIPLCYLDLSSPIQNSSIAQRMSWASKRSTTRIEDMAYCLLGLFDVNMPLLYGEGTKAFQRLQQAIIAQSDDETIFAWISDTKGDQRGILANAPSEFARTGHIRPIHFENKCPPPTITSRGLQIQYAYAHPLASIWDKGCESVLGQPVSLRLFWKFMRGQRVSLDEQKIFLRLDCVSTDDEGHNSWIGIPLRRDVSTGNWYREDAATLLQTKQQRLPKTLFPSYVRLYPAYVGYRQLYVELYTGLPWKSLLRDSSSTSDEDKVRLAHTTSPAFHTFYSRPVLINLLYQVAKIVSGTSFIWLLCVLHYRLGFASPNLLMCWAYLTAGWHLQGQHANLFLSVFILGIFGWGVNWSTYSSRNLFTALLGFFPMFCLQVYFDKARWEVMPS